MDPRKLYNNGRWSSPSAVRFCKESGLDKNYIPNESIKVQQDILKLI